MEMKQMHSFTHRSTLRAALAVLALGTAVASGPLAFAQATDCVHVGGSFTTNFTAPDQTAGTATGDLKGALGVKLLGTVSGTVGDGKPVTLKVQHFWVTESGDTIASAETEVTAYPGGSPTQPLLYSSVYEKGVKITGGTGKFEGATGSLKVWAAIDLAAGEAAGRYAGVICFKPPTPAPALNAGAMQNGQFQFQVSAPASGQVVAEASSNLKDWEAFGTKTAVNGSAEFADANAATEPKRFFRAKGE